MLKSSDSNYKKSIFPIHMFYNYCSCHGYILNGVASGELFETLLSILNVYQKKPENLFTQKVMTS